jgi:DNA-binding phage protein
MPRRYHKVHSLLRSVQDAAAERRTNAYQIAKATGLPLRSVQKLLRQTHNPTLRNVEVILSGLGLSLYLKSGGLPTINPGKRSPPTDKRID